MLPPHPGHFTFTAVTKETEIGLSAAHLHDGVVSQTYSDSSKEDKAHIHTLKFHLCFFNGTMQILSANNSGLFLVELIELILFTTRRVLFIPGCSGLRIIVWVLCVHSGHSATPSGFLTSRFPFDNKPQEEDTTGKKQTTNSHLTNKPTF